jgi:hypothetical protein
MFSICEIVLISNKFRFQKKDRVAFTEDQRTVDHRAAGLAWARRSLPQRPRLRCLRRALRCVTHGLRPARLSATEPCRCMLSCCAHDGTIWHTAYFALVMTRWLRFFFSANRASATATDRAYREASVTTVACVLTSAACRRKFAMASVSTLQRSSSPSSIASSSCSASP